MKDTRGRAKCIQKKKLRGKRKSGRNGPKNTKQNQINLKNEEVENKKNIKHDIFGIIPICFSG